MLVCVCVCVCVYTYIRKVSRSRVIERLNGFAEGAFSPPLFLLSTRIFAKFEFLARVRVYTCITVGTYIYVIYVLKVPPLARGSYHFSNS